MSRALDHSRAGSDDAPGPALRALGSLIAIPAARFAREHWGREPLLSRTGTLPGTAAKALDLAGIDELLSERGLRTPFLRLTRDGEVLTAARYTAGGGAGATIADQVSDTALLDLLADGVTAVLQGLHRTWRPVADLASDLSLDLGVPVQANAYVTPPDSRGFDHHYDVHDVFVVQLHGRKHWQVHAPVFADPLADQPWTGHRAEIAYRVAETPVLDTVLEPGDVLYLPRGTVHGAVTEGDLSAHLTLGVHPVTAYTVAQSALRLLRDDPLLRASLPLGRPTADGVADALRRLADAVTGLEPGAATDAVCRGVAEQTRPEPMGPLAQLAALRALTLTTRLRLRPGLHTVLDATALTAANRRVAVAPEEAEALARVLTGEPFTPADLGDGERAGLRDGLAGRLVRAGVVTPV